MNPLFVLLIALLFPGETLMLTAVLSCNRKSLILDLPVVYVLLIEIYLYWD